MNWNIEKEAIMQEAFMTGRIYSRTGEKELPQDIQEKLKSNCERAVNNLFDYPRD